MDFKSKLFGVQQIDPDTIITFPKGIPGFEAQTRYKLFHQEGSHIVYWLQCLDDADLVFSVASHAHFNLNYNFVLTPEEQALLKLDNLEDILILLLLQKDELDKPTVKGSIKAPIIINSAERLGMQKILLEVEQSITLTEKHNAIELTEL
ncbi:MAG: flagellar assembly protein FliW [Methylococcaceae bacterium]|nr:flagellar assembly protein FliW [Methylococcaceae bacterium]